ncbi:hypothetical protein WN944_010177 [Citrus x changshan-huyou]|uniref:Nudix hydrolase 12 n=3 Tax=Citrus TaxID=2706 RepID=A0ACB8N082_CITSI|nr:Nudix hydrolase 12 [Citrus sinensis]
MSVEARTGRLRQRYDNNFRLVSGCIPYRLTKDAEDENEDIQTRIEVLMVSSPNRSDLVFPKGGWENDETVMEAACREALEEAGVRGKLNEKPLGIWEFRSKSKQDLHSLEGGCRGYMFSLEVTEELEIWPEQENRYRKWLNIQDAFQLCRYEWMREALEKFMKVMSEEQKVEITEEIVEPLPKPVPDVIAECQIVSSNYCVTTTSSQHHGISAIIPFHWQIPKRLPLT